MTPSTGGRDEAPKAASMPMWLWEAGDTWILLATKAGPFHAESLPSPAMVQDPTWHQSGACAQHETYSNTSSLNPTSYKRKDKPGPLTYTSTAFGLWSYVHPTQTQGEGPQNTALPRRKADADQPYAVLLRHKTPNSKLSPFLSTQQLHHHVPSI